MKKIALILLCCSNLLGCAKEQKGIIGLKLKSPSTTLHIYSETDLSSNETDAHDCIPREIIDYKTIDDTVWYYVKAKDSLTKKNMTGWTTNLHYFLEEYDEDLLFRCFDDFIKQEPYTREILKPNLSYDCYKDYPRVNEFLYSFIEEACQAGLSKEYIMEVAHNLTYEFPLEEVAEFEKPFYLMLAKHDLIKEYFDELYYNLSYNEENLCYGKDREPLLTAAIKNNAVNSVEYLVKSVGVNVDVPDITGKTSREYARESSSEEIRNRAGYSSDKVLYQKVIEKLINDKQYKNYHNSFDEYYGLMSKSEAELESEKTAFRISINDNHYVYSIENTVLIDSDNKEIPVNRGESLVPLFSLEKDYAEPGFLTENKKTYIKYYVVKKENGQIGIISDLYLAQDSIQNGVLISYYEKFNDHEHKIARRINIPDGENGIDLDISKTKISDIKMSSYFIFGNLAIPFILINNQLYSISNGNMIPVMEFDIPKIGYPDGTYWRYFQSTYHPESIFLIRVKTGEDCDSYLKSIRYDFKIKEGTKNQLVLDLKNEYAEVPSDL